MAVPFRRKSSTRVRKGRGPKSWAFQQRSYSAQPLIKCSNCQVLKVLHQICSHCLTYKELDFKKVSVKQANHEREK